MRRLVARLRSRGTATGAATLEYVAAIGLAGVIAVAVATSATNARMGVIVTDAICKVTTAVGYGTCAGDDGGTDDPPTDPPFDPKPTKCKINEHSEKVNSEIKIAFFKIGENAGFVETTYSDGTVTFTATDGAGLGVTGGVGAKFDIGKLEAGAKVDFGAGVKVDYGSTWVFEDADEAKDMREQLDKYLVEQETLKHDTSGGYAIYLAIKGATEPPKPPTQSVTSIEINGDVTGKVGLTLPWEKDDPDSSSSSGLPNVKLADAGLKFGGSDKWTQITDSDAKTTTWTTSGEVFGQLNGSLGPLAGELKGVLGSSMAITRDEHDQITKVTLVTSQEGKVTGTVNAGQTDLGGSASNSGSDSQVTVTTTSLDVTTDAQRGLVDAWLAAQSETGGAVSPQTYFPSTLVAGDDFQNLMYTNATVSNVVYDNVSDKTGFAAEVKLGVALGVDFSLETTDSTASEASYLDVPGSDGVRPPVDFAECIAE